MEDKKLLQTLNIFFGIIGVELGVVTGELISLIFEIDKGITSLIFVCIFSYFYGLITGLIKYELQ